MDLVGTVGLLADGRWHHVDDAGQCQAMLYDVGLTAAISPDGRCRLSDAIELLDAGRIESALSQPERVTLNLTGTTDSTNTQLLNQPAPPLGKGVVLLAEYQTAGRGRHGRTWLCPYAGGLCLSVAWQFESVPRHPGTLSLAVGVGLLRALARHGVTDIKLKWPNDMLYDHRKLGGVLIDVARVDNTMQVVAGVGINLILTSRQSNEIVRAGGIEAVALSEIDRTLAARRNALAAAVIDHMIAVFVEFGQKGFEPFQREYNVADALNGRAVHVAGPAGSLDGQAVGIDEAGALLVQTGDTTHSVYSGDVRVRM